MNTITAVAQHFMHKMRKKQNQISIFFISCHFFPSIKMHRTFIPEGWLFYLFMHLFSLCYVSRTSTSDAALCLFVSVRMSIKKIFF